MQGNAGQICLLARDNEVVIDSNGRASEPNSVDLEQGSTDLEDEMRVADGEGDSPREEEREDGSGSSEDDDGSGVDAEGTDVAVTGGEASAHEIDIPQLTIEEGRKIGTEVSCRGIRGAHHDSFLTKLCTTIRHN